jgi:hypothetical protein
MIRRWKMANDTPTETPTDSTPSTSAALDHRLKTEARNVGIAAIFTLVGLTVAAAIYAGTRKGWMAGTLAGYSAFAAGVFVGFLFGVPHASKSNNNPQQEGHAAFLTNSNLVEISDWLTKILVGLGLIQLGRATHGLGSLIDSVRIGLGRGSGSTLMAAGLLIVGAVGGFMCSYLVTVIMGPRLFLQAAQAGEEAEKALTQIKAAATEAQAAATQAQVVANDSLASQLVRRQLDEDSAEVNQSDLVTALQAASPGERALLGQLAADQRRFNRDNPKRQALHDRTIKVFRSLTAAEPKTWVYHAGLGYALGEAAQPQFEESFNELDTAIRLRGNAKQATDFFAELARADALIKLSGNNMTDDQRRQVASDLETATKGNPDIAEIVAAEPDLRNALNSSGPENVESVSQDSNSPAH